MQLADLITKTPKGFEPPAKASLVAACLASAILAWQGFTALELGSDEARLAIKGETYQAMVTQVAKIGSKRRAQIGFFDEQQRQHLAWVAGCPSTCAPGMMVKASAILDPQGGIVDVELAGTSKERLLSLLLRSILCSWLGYVALLNWRRWDASRQGDSKAKEPPSSGA